ncbi:MAG: TetR family transcriptional regulator [Hyphomicrobiaceae bacterium]|nr:MAG: TetR family transcriptional regulator [Hyphomicrobiaceae bacterium]
MHAICAAADMSPGALYRYFPSKEAIIEAIAAEERENNRRLLAYIAVEKGIVEALIDTGIAWIREVTQTGGTALCAEVLAEAQRNPRIRDIFEKNLVEVREAIRDALARAQANGEIDPVLDVNITTTFLMAMGDGLVVRMPFEPDMTPDRIEPALRDIVHRMLRPWPAAAPNPSGRE